MEEIWKDIPGYEGLYQVSSLGRIKSLRTGKLRKPGNNGAGYLFVPLSNKTTKNRYVHRLVALSFLDNPYNKSTVNHKNGIKTDNCVGNLEWATQSENSQHGFDTGLIKQKSGKDNINSKQVLKYTLEGSFLCKYYSLTEAYTDTGILPQVIGVACSGRFKQAGGFQWRFYKGIIPNTIKATGKKGNGEKPVIQCSKHGVILNEFKSATEAGIITGILRNCIGDNCRSVTQSAGGFIWKFKK